MMTSMTFADAAAWYVSMGWRVIRLRPGSKIPYAGSHGYKDATDDADVIDRWVRETPDANIGIAVARDMVLLDVDPRHGGYTDLDALVRRNGGWSAMPAAPRVLTRSGGAHAYFSMEGGLDKDHCRGTKVAGLGVQIKRHGTYVVAPPSIVVPDADEAETAKAEAWPNVYAWSIRPLGPNLPPLPKWIWDILKKPKPRHLPGSASAPASLDSLVAWAGGLQKGNRDEGLFWAANRALEAVRSGKVAAGEAYASLYDAGLRTGQDSPDVERALRMLRNLTPSRE